MYGNQNGRKPQGVIVDVETAYGYRYFVSIRDAWYRAEPCATPEDAGKAIRRIGRTYGIAEICMDKLPRTDAEALDGVLRNFRWNAYSR